MSNLISGLWIWVEQEEQSDLLWSGFWRRRGCDRPESNFCKNSHQDCSRLVSRVKMILKQQLNMSRQARRVNLENTLFFHWQHFNQVDIVRASRLHTGPDVSWCILSNALSPRSKYQQSQANASQCIEDRKGNWVIWIVDARLSPSLGNISDFLHLFFFWFLFSVFLDNLIHRCEAVAQS